MIKFLYLLIIFLSMAAPVLLTSVLAFLVHSKTGGDESKCFILWQKLTEQKEVGQTAGKPQEKLVLFSELPCTGG